MKNVTGNRLRERVRLLLKEEIYSTADEPSRGIGSYFRNFKSMFSGGATKAAVK